MREALEPARITALDSDIMRVDLNHPFARFPVQVRCKLNRVLPGYDRRGGRCTSPLDELVRYPGLASPLPDGSPTDFGDDGNGMSRMDEREDPVFYTNPRLVQDLNQSGTLLPFDDASLDVVVCTASLEYLIQPRDMFTEVLRVLLGETSLRRALREYLIHYHAESDQNI